MSIATLDAPLVELGAITDERQNDRGTRSWRERTAAGTTVYAYLFNNYWHTNYKAYQQGPLTYRFVLRPHGAYDALALRRFSDEQDHPLLVFAVDPAAPATQAPFTLAGDPVTISSLRVADDGAALVARIFNPSPKPATVTLRPAAQGALVSVMTGRRRAGRAGRPRHGARAGHADRADRAALGPVSYPACDGLMPPRERGMTPPSMNLRRLRSACGRFSCSAMRASVRVAVRTPPGPAPSPPAPRARRRGGARRGRTG